MYESNWLFIEIKIEILYPKLLFTYHQQLPHKETCRINRNLVSSTALLHLEWICLAPNYSLVHSIATDNLVYDSKNYSNTFSMLSFYVHYKRNEEITQSMHSNSSNQRVKQFEEQ